MIFLTYCIHCKNAWITIIQKKLVPILYAICIFKITYFFKQNATSIISRLSLNSGANLEVNPICGDDNMICFHVNIGYVLDARLPFIYDLKFFKNLFIRIKVLIVVMADIQNFWPFVQSGLSNKPFPVQNWLLISGIKRMSKLTMWILDQK